MLLNPRGAVGGVGIDDELKLAVVGARTGCELDKDTGDDDEGIRDETKARGPFGGTLPVIAVSNDMAGNKITILAGNARA